MKNFNKNIDSFIKWCDENDWSMPTPELYKLYRLENEAPALTEEENNYLRVLYRVLLEAAGMNGTAKSDMTRFVLANEYGWGDKSTVKNQIVDYVLFDTSGLKSENTSAKNHENENYINTAITGDIYENEKN